MVFAAGSLAIVRFCLGGRFGDRFDDRFVDRFDDRSVDRFVSSYRSFVSFARAKFYLMTNPPPNYLASICL